jgi:hypothetical protein
MSAAVHFPAARTRPTDAGPAAALHGDCDGGCHGLAAIGRRLAFAALLALLAGWMPGALAHKPSDAYLSLALGADGQRIEGQWDIALRDLELAVGLDRDRDGAITWGELEAARPGVEAYAYARLALRLGDTACPLGGRDLLVDRHSDGAYAVLRFSAECPRRIDALDIDYRLLFDLDRQHKGLLKVVAATGVESAVVDADTPRRRIRIADISAWNHLADYTVQGVGHIWIGIDHILFLLALLLPAVLYREAGRFVPVAAFRPAFIDVVKIVTAFTLAHSITLSAATLGWVALPSRLVESAIAFSVVLAALNNLAPRPARRRWLVAFAFGLVHGFGFASVLADLGLPDSALLVALLGFNLGVELGQLAIVAGFLPLAFLLRATPFYRRGVFVGGSALIALIAGLWFAERAFDLKFMPF